MQQSFTNMRSPVRSPLFRVGGKYRLKIRLRKLMPSNFNVYHEPFCGAAHLFFYSHATKAVLSDTSPEILMVLASIRDDVDRFIERARYLLLNHNSRFFFKIRDSPQHPADLWYLSHHSIMGKKFTVVKDKNRGNEAVPRWGAFKRIKPAHFALREVSILSVDWRECNPSAGDFVYLDPPYLGASGYHQYKAMSEEDHVELAQWATRMAEQGVKLMASNSDEAAKFWDPNIWRRHEVKVTYPSENYAFKEQTPKKEMLVTNY